MMDRSAVIFTVFVAIAAMLLVAMGVSLGMKMATFVMQNQAIERGYAEHDAKTGQWKWIEKGAGNE